MISQPILFKGPLVRRTLAGRKTETRRIITRLRGIGRVTEFQPSIAPGYDWFMRDPEMRGHAVTTADLLSRCPYGVPGDWLWVKERWRAAMRPTGMGYRLDSDGAFIPIGTTPEAAAAWNLRYRKPGGRPSIYMPREACRLELPIQEVRAERLQDITDEGVIREGVARLLLYELLEMGASMRRIVNSVLALGFQPEPDDKSHEGTAQRFLISAPLRDRFRVIWDLINGHRPGCSWESNPGVWVIRWRER